MDKPSLLEREWIAENVLASGEAGEYLGISRQAINKAVKRGSLIPIKDGLFLKSDLDAYYEAATLKRPKSAEKMGHKTPVT
jgi:biotin operon repressor